MPSLPASLLAAIDAELPQTQCTRCGYPGCEPYAAAIVAGAADINQCPPGGDATIERLAKLLGRSTLPLNPANGQSGPPMLAVIDESRCVGCTKCLPPCPTDAIVGASRQMHTVIAALCTGCELCIAPCPVDCITLVRRDSIAGAGAEPSALDNRRRYHAHRERDAARAQQRAQEIVRAKSGALAWPAP